MPIDLRWTVLPPVSRDTSRIGEGEATSNRLAGDPGHLHQRVDGAVERQRAIEQALGRRERDDLGDRP